MPPSQADSSNSGSPRFPGAEKLAPGTEIGRFQIRHLLGQGGMGAVYLAWDPVLERKVALKAIRLGQDGQVASQGRFRREAMALAQLVPQELPPEGVGGLFDGLDEADHG